MSGNEAHVRRMARSLLAMSLAALLLSACATRAGFDARQAALVGLSEAELVATLGVPVRTYDAEGRRFLQYEDQRVVSAGGLSGPYGGFGYGGFGRRGLAYAGTSFGPVVETLECNTTFELRGGRVVGFNARGNACLAPEPRSGATRT